MIALASKNDDLDFADCAGGGARAGLGLSPIDDVVLLGVPVPVWWLGMRVFGVGVWMVPLVIGALLAGM